MKLIKISFYYLASYLGLAGVAFLFFPTAFQKLLFASEIYPEVPMHIAGMFALLLSIVVLQINRKGLTPQLYPTSIFARAIAIVIILVLYFQTHNPFFIAMFCIVILGVLLTTVGHFKNNN